MTGWANVGGWGAAAFIAASLSAAIPGGAPAVVGPAVGPDTATVVWRTIGFAAPVLLAPLVVIGLRPLYARFLREGAEVFTDTYLDPDLFRAVGHYMAIINVAVFILIWAGAFACEINESRHIWTCLIVIGGVLGALAMTVRLVGKAVGLHGRTAFYVGLVVFGGGNLPLIVLVPAILVFV